MLLDLSRFNLEGKTVAVAISGGSDSVALIHYMKSKADKFRFSLKAVNVEHGIRGESSKKDSLFVKNLCTALEIPLRNFCVDAPTFCEENKFSLEEGARVLRYKCFYQAIDEGFCNLVATAHHENDNFETLLFNLFRGTGTDGVSGIGEITEKGIIRPLLKTSKEEINNYIKENALSFVVDESNFDDKYTRNYLRQRIIPIIKEIFPLAEKSGARFSEIISQDAEFLNEEAKKQVTLYSDRAEIKPCHPALFNRAVIIALKHLGIKKDWEKKHLDDSYSLLEKENGKSVNLLGGVVAIKEYDKVVFFKPLNSKKEEFPFSLGEFATCGQTVKVSLVEKPKNLKDGFYADEEKIPKTAVIRTKEEGDVFTKFGGGTKSLGDYLTDKKVPLRERESLPLIADGKEILAIFGVAISNKIRVDENTKNVIKLELL